MVRITSARSKISQWNRGSVWAYPNQIPPGHRSNCSNFASRVPTGEGCNDRNRYGHDALGRFGRDDQAAAVPMRVPREGSQRDLDHAGFHGRPGLVGGHSYKPMNRKRAPIRQRATTSVSHMVIEGSAWLPEVALVRRRRTTAIEIRSTTQRFPIVRGIRSSRN